MTEARISQAHSILLLLSAPEAQPLLAGFCGSVLTAAALAGDPACVRGKTVYVCGEIASTDMLARQLAQAARVLVVAERSRGYEEGVSRGLWSVVDSGRVPVLVHGVGVYLRRFFDPAVDYFARIRSEHVFQSLTESTKGSRAHRSGIYLTPVVPRGDALHFHLLRCSTNLSGPTESFRSTDWHIVEALNQEAARLFEGHAPLNHVLAQIYHNTPATEEQRQTKAKIKSHADKTKDMPVNGIMAFCTFYDRLDGLERSADDPFDYGHKRTSALTRLDFRLKDVVAARPGCTLPAHFSVTLYPGSAFFMPLSTNRLYTHEIRSSALDAAMLPTRLGYVVRCSDTEAVHEGGRTFLVSEGGRVELEPPTPEGLEELRRLYAEENTSDALIEYGDRFRFSMNEGDYRAPQYHGSDELRRYTIASSERLFDTLSASVAFEVIAKGREGAVLVAPDPTRGVPIVRTTTKYGRPAQLFGAVPARLAAQIQALASLPTRFDNALVERYGSEYRKMGFHSDQALDLQEGSYIAIFSCYRDPEKAPSRTLYVEPKEPGLSAFEIPLSHHSVVVLSLQTNRRFRHKIEPSRHADAVENDWLGVTLRTSRTFVRYLGSQPTLEDGTPLTLADDDRARELYALRAQENREADFTYPRITCTLSPSDLWPPLPASELSSVRAF